MELARELETYKIHQTELVLDHAGEYALIRGGEIEIVESYENASSRGFEKYGLDPLPGEADLQVRARLLLLPEPPPLSTIQGRADHRDLCVAATFMLYEGLVQALKP